MAKVTSYRELLAEQANAAVRISGAHHSSWNGRTAETDPGEKVDGKAEWNHTIRYSDERIGEPLRDMFRNSRVHNQDPDTLRSYRKAIKTMLHENVHLLAAEGAEHSQGRQEYQITHGRIAEEGFTELYSSQQTDAYIDELGVDEIAPGIKAARRHEIYQDYVQGAQAFAETVGQRSGLSSEEVVRRMAGVDAAQKFEVAAAAIYDNSDLPGLVPSDQRDAAVKRIAAAMKPDFARIEDAKANKDPDLRQREARVAGGAAARAGYDEVRAIRRQWSQPAPQTRQAGPRLQQAAQNQHSAQNQQTTRPGDRQPPGQSGQEQRSPGAPSELDQAMRAGLGGSRPLAAATRLSADQQGSRRPGEQGRDRPGPQHER